MQIVAAPTTFLASPLGTTDTSMVLQSFEDQKGNPITLTQTGSQFALVVKQALQIEIILCNAITQNSDGTCTIGFATDGRNLDPTAPYAGYSGGLSFDAGADVMLTNDPWTMSQFLIGTDAETISGLFTFTTPPVVPTPTSPTQAANKEYVDGIAIAGAPDASATTLGIAKMTVAPASPTDPLAVGDNDPRVPTLSQAEALVGDTGTPSSSNKFITQQSPFLVPTGTLLAYAASAAPTGYLICDGSAVSRTTYAILFGIIATTFGDGDGSTTFNLPDMRGQVPAGYKSSDANFGTLGAEVGEATHVLTQTEMPAHTHTYGSASTVSASGAGISPSAPGSGNTGSTGGGAAHNNIQPSLTLNFIIKT